MKSMVVAGIMSGTSADGVDVALCKISPDSSKSRTPRIKLLGHASFPYPKAVRAAVLAAMDARSISVSDLSRLTWRLGELYADAVSKAQTKIGIKAELIGCHGQTLYHQSAAAKYLGAPVRCTWQTCEPSLITERLHVPVVSDFRPADMAAGGQGAPLVPMLDYVMFRSAKVNRVLQNLGGIGNLTALPAGAGSEALLAFDSGPANMVIDACMARLFDKPFDRNGAIARRGHILEPIVACILRESYFSALPPKSCGREEFGEAFASRFITQCRKAGASSTDIIATATALTADSIADAYRRFVEPHLSSHAPRAKTEFVVAGGGVRNTALMAMLQVRFAPFGVKVRSMEELGISSQAKESVAFALLAWLTWFDLPGNIPAATGASRNVVLGRITLA